MKKIDFRSTLERGLEWRAVTRIIKDADQMVECLASEGDYTAVCYSNFVDRQF